MNIKEILDHELTNLEIKIYNLIDGFKRRFISKLKFENDEEMKKFTQGFAYKPPQEANNWLDFTDDIYPLLERDVWISDGRSVIYIHKWGEADLDNYERGYVWQYAYPPELPEKKEEISHSCHEGNVWCFEENGKLFITLEKEAYECSYCPICGFSLKNKE